MGSVLVLIICESDILVADVQRDLCISRRDISDLKGYLWYLYKYYKATSCLDQRFELCEVPKCFEPI